MHEGVFNLAGEVEADECYIGGKVRFMHSARRKAYHRGEIKKTMVFGMLERNAEPGKSRVYVEPVVNRRRHSLDVHIRKNVVKGSSVYTDSLPSYNELKNDYTHAWVDHNAGQYVNGRVSTNGMENFWSCMKRGMKGTYIIPATHHLFRYCNEAATRFNERSETDQGRFLKTMQRADGRRLPYRALTGRVWEKGGF